MASIRVNQRKKYISFRNEYPSSNYNGFFLTNDTRFINLMTSRSKKPIAGFLCKGSTRSKVPILTGSQDQTQRGDFNKQKHESETFFRWDFWTRRVVHTRLSNNTQMGANPTPSVRTLLPCSLLKVWKHLVDSSSGGDTTVFYGWGTTLVCLLLLSLQTL